MVRKHITKEINNKIHYFIYNIPARGKAPRYRYISFLYADQIIQYPNYPAVCTDLFLFPFLRSC